MYEDTTLIPLFRELAGISGYKPFECVGTNEEIIWSMHESIKQIHRTSMHIPVVLADIENSPVYAMSEDFFTKLSEKLFQKQENNIPLSLL